MGPGERLSVRHDDQMCMDALLEEAGPESVTVVHGRTRVRRELTRQVSHRQGQPDEGEASLNKGVHPVRW